MATVAEAIRNLVERVEALEAAVAELQSQQTDEWNQEIDVDLPIPTPTSRTSSDVRGRESRVELPEVKTDDLEPAELAELEAARQRLVNDRGGVMEDAIPEGQRAKLTEDEVVLPSVSEEQRAKRRQFAEKINLEADFGAEAIDAYVKGGPLWLYYGNRDYVMGLPTWAHEQMLKDIEATSPAEAYEFGRDVFMRRDPEGITFDEVIKNG